MDPERLRRKDTTKGPPLRILSLDGGGIRGYSMLILLQELMHRTFVEIEGRAPRRDEIPKPCDHFDLIAGTGTGGLIALMLGRLRMDIETCKNLYVRMTRRVFETDKTFAGVPYRSTLFKASKLEEAIRECVREHTVHEDEGNDILASQANLSSPISPGSMGNAPQRTMSVASRYSQIGTTPTVGNQMYTKRWGDPNAYLYDTRENRTKCAVTAVYKGSKKNTPAILLRSYDSRKEPAPEFNCRIWQAGRATCATGIAFKPIQIGQSVFTDEGGGKFNPSPQILDEAVCNEWPGREVGVFISIGTGKRPKGTNSQQHLWWEDFVGSGLSDFAEARRRLAAKIEGCEDTHQYVLREHLSKRNVNAANYYRLNVEVGVGEFGMNEWNRLAEISTNTRMYLSRNEVQGMNHDAAAKLSRIHRAKIRWERALRGEQPILPKRFDQLNGYPPNDPMAVELPAEDVLTPPVLPQRPSSWHNSPQHAPPARRSSTDEKILLPSSDEFPQPVETPATHLPPPSRPSHEYTAYNSGRPSFEYMERLNTNGSIPPGRMSTEDTPTITPLSPPPLPPKTPLSGANGGSRPPPLPARDPGRNSGAPVLPYPDTDGPPPVVNMARKPEYNGR